MTTISNILLPEGQEEPVLTDDQERNYEQRFFLLCHLHLQPSEYEKLSEVERDWLIQRFIYQKQEERRIMEEMRRGSINPISADFLKEIERSKNG